MRMASSLSPTSSRARAGDSPETAGRVLALRQLPWIPAAQGVRPSRPCSHRSLRRLDPRLRAGAAVAESSAAPGVSRDPAMTSTQPRPSLSTSAAGIGNGHFRSARCVEAPGAAQTPALHSWAFHQDLGAAGSIRCVSYHGVPACSNGATKIDQAPGTSLPFLPAVGSNSYDVIEQFGTSLHAIDFENLPFVHAFEQVTKAVDDHLVADYQYAFAPVFARDRVDDIAQAQDHVAPAFAARGRK